MPFRCKDHFLFPPPPLSAHLKAFKAHIPRDEHGAFRLLIDSDHRWTTVIIVAASA